MNEPERLDEERAKVLYAAGVDRISTPARYAAVTHALTAYAERAYAWTAEPLAAALEQGIEAVRITREYVGEDLLPNIEGWSHYDFVDSASAALADYRSRTGESKAGSA